MKKKQLQIRFDELATLLKGQQNNDGFWTGKLSSSALGVAVAIAALNFDDADGNAPQIRQGLLWLKNNINTDGSFGDTPESPGNISTSLLVYAALNLYRQDAELAGQTQDKLAAYLASMGIDVHSSQVAKTILAHYKKDYTFSVPILAMCGLCQVPGEEAFEYIPQLPFELSLLPRKFYRVLNLNVVSYAIPALVAVGIVVFKKKKSNLFWRLVRKYSIGKAMGILQKMLPESGGFLEAIPLTAFVCLSLVNSGYGDSEIVKKGNGFLKSTQREDGSWPIDVDLSTWVTSLSVKALGNRLPSILSEKEMLAIANHFKAIQNKQVHAFNGTQPGGWGWTNFPGSVPDGDDTPGAILALLKLQGKEICREEVLAAGKWLLKLQNKDGGFPTFSKGWGKLPFDQSCADLTGHCLLAFSAILDAYGGYLPRKENKAYKKGFLRGLGYLKKQQSENGHWLPLWFGNQLTKGHKNPVYGTARVLAYLKESLGHNWQDIALREDIYAMVKKGERFLVGAQNTDGSWGGDHGVVGTIEETALAVSALSGKNHLPVCFGGLTWLDNYYKENGLVSAPIGLYFASLWYDEGLYPLTAYLEGLGQGVENSLNPPKSPFEKGDILVVGFPLKKGAFVLPPSNVSVKLGVSQFQNMTYVQVVFLFP